MRGKLQFFGTLGLVFLLVAIGVTQGDFSKHRYNLSMEQLKHCGIENLSDTETQNLSSFLGGYGCKSFIESSAEQYMLKQGWEYCQVLGRIQKLKNAARPELGKNEYVAIIRNGRVNLTEPPLITKGINPGHYWVKGIGSGWEILGINGQTDGTYWVKETW